MFVRCSGVIGWAGFTAPINGSSVVTDRARSVFSEGTALDSACLGSAELSP
ncbi:MAG: hypothetical protein QM755_24960 [Luteolibacter sp.]